MTTFIEGFLPAFAANVAAMMVQVAGKKICDKFDPSDVQQAIARCIGDGMTALLAKSADPSPENEHILTDCFRDYFGNEAVARELSKLLRGKEPDIEELTYLFEDEAGYDRNNLPGLDFDRGIQAFIAAFMESALLEPKLNTAIQAGQLINQTRIQRELLEEMREMVACLREYRVVGIRAGEIRAENVVSGIQIIHQLTPAHASELPDDTEERHYLKVLIEKCDALELAAIDESCTADDVIRISDVFTSLNLTRQRFPGQAIEDTLTGRKEELQKRESSDRLVPIQAIEAAGALSRLVILGGPGSGKSTLVNYIATRLAGRWLTDAVKFDDLPGFAADESPIPVRIVLRQFAAWIPGERKKGDAGLVWRYLEYMLDEHWGCKCYSHIRQILQKKGGVIFFDGLDEVREKDEDAKRSVITEAIRDFANPLDKCRIIVTCREYAYKKTDGWRLPEKAFPVAELALFDMEQIGAFAQTWYRVIGPQKDWNAAKQEAEADSLFRAIKAMPHLKEIAQYPLLMTLMAQVHGRDGYLPKDRADLYERAVNLLLEHWDNRIIRDTDGTCRRESGWILRLGLRRDTLRSALERVAFSAHEHQETETDRSDRCADISKLDLLEELEKDLGSLDAARDVIDYISKRSGLLIAQDNKTYTFPHRTFQEYLAAAHIMKRSDFNAFLKERIRRDPDWWREVFLLAAGCSKNIPLTVSNMVDALLPYGPKTGTITPENSQYARLSAQALIETDFPGHVEKERRSTGYGNFSRTYEQIQSWLVESLGANETLSPNDRVESGRVLGQLGDPRKEVMTPEHMLFCLVPGGDFYMGDGDERHLNSHLKYDYWMARHPVTNAQYFEFVKAGGYAEARYWGEAKEVGYWKSGKFKGRLENNFHNKPYGYGSPFNLPNHPVVGVSWYESLVFTRWLTDAWREKDIIGKKWRVRLPSEAEWEKAARGGQQIPEKPVVFCPSDRAWENKSGVISNPGPERTYPWGDEIERDSANYRETGIGTTNAIGCFSSGKSPFGCFDMAGNVWEWTRSLWGKKLDTPDFIYPYEPNDGRENEVIKKDMSCILRGGSFFNLSGNLRCAARFRNFPDGRHDYWGFRCVCVPDTSDL
ncbi:hypothetical protein DENIS_3761 [Desulfonema ishimotonii]|uniref:NACHT domain-containing protein n=1 Tax=Desulfonema ishimotonii TaxID=45657 RepID=A0A401G0N9_9BACT|nr:SUMF1/EgtB/PvdO family nonheme iron enzyme [Desulfonema ishimotonii]GBC62784.1 hypothetical protein DENIS_3761 [Desulfonema ishimotonii]